MKPVVLAISLFAHHLIFGVWRLVAAFAVASKARMELLSKLTCCQSGDESPHSKLFAGGPREVV
jgi:hypothetical protein